MLEVVSAGGNLAVMPATTFNRMISGVVSLTKLCHDKPWLYALSFDWVSGQRWPRYRALRWARCNLM